MLIKRIKAKNYKTYLNLDLDISVDSDRPIILIGGANGGGKTTFFEAIYGALYGLDIPTTRVFRELLNAGKLGEEEEKILLELHFSGRVLNEDHQYILTRSYILNTENKPVESVKLNMNGTIFQYGTATPTAQRALQKEQVDKILKANLPQELSKYFLFDAMKSGQLLEKDQLNRVIKENIENVMGFNKYIQLAKSSELIYQEYTAQRIQHEEERKDYIELTKQKADSEKEIKILDNEFQDALNYSVSNKELYDNLKKGLDEEKTIKNKINNLSNQIETIYDKERLYIDELERFIKNFEYHVCLPKVTEALRSEITLVLKEFKQKQFNNENTLTADQIENITSIVYDYLKEYKIELQSITKDEIINHVIDKSTTGNTNYKYDFLDFSEIKALENLLKTNYSNPFLNLNTQKIDLNISIDMIVKLKEQIEEYKSQSSGKDYTFLKAYEDNEERMRKIEEERFVKNKELRKLIDKIEKFDIQTSQEPDPKYEMIKKLKSFFEDIANKLLHTKKQQIEINMKEDLNVNLAAYRDVIGKVELSEHLSDLTFKIFHTKGNEIYLNQLNAASKQVVVQVLLKALREFGDYDPPVMIDTVMGVLDKETRNSVIENYFPTLSHQTILLSSDTEIRVEDDYDKIEPFVSKTFTLRRDKELQKTEIVEGYFHR
jgi:DNA sulfur modification protein DndD